MTKKSKSEFYFRLALSLLSEEELKKWAEALDAVVTRKEGEESLND